MIRPAFPHDIAFDVNDDPLRIGDRAALVTDRHRDAAVVSVFGGKFGPANIELEWPTGHREIAFGADTVRVK